MQSSQGNLTWNTPAQPVSFESLTFRAGFFYSNAGAVPWPGEPSAVNTELKVSRRADPPALELSEHPSYEQLTPGQRRAYLEWIAASRDDADPADRALGYVLLAFYGLERRILIDGDPDPAILDEVMRMMHRYGVTDASCPLRSYFLQLLHVGGWRLGAPFYRSIWPDLLQVDGDRPDADGMRMVLANLYELGEPLHWTVAYRVALIDENSRRSTVTSRVREQFWELFHQRFEEQHPGGIMLQAAKQEAVMACQPANPAVLQLAIQQRRLSQLEWRFPNVLGLRRQFKKLPEIWNSCVQDLSGFSRARGSKKQGITAAVAAWKALPGALQDLDEHPVRLAMNELLAEAPTENSFPVVPVGDIAAIHEIPMRDKLTVGQLSKLGESLAAVGWFMTPNPAFVSVALSWDQEVAIYPRGHWEVPEPQVPAVIRLLFLATALAAADGVVTDREVELFESHVGHELRSERDWKHLRATQAVLRRDYNLAVRALPQIARSIPLRSRSHVFRGLVHTAATDGEIGPDEIKVLRRIQKLLTLPEGTLDELLGKDKAFSEVVVVPPSGIADAGEAIPPRQAGSNQVVPGLKLDRDRLEALKKETHEVITMLAEVMSEEESSAAMVEEKSAIPHSPAAQAGVRVDEGWMLTLDRRYRGALGELVRQEEVPCEVFERIASKHLLMPDDLLSAVNSWSDECLGDFLLERSDVVRVYLDLLPPHLRISRSIPLQSAA